MSGVMYIFGSESAIEEGKIFTREVGDRVFSYPDFRLPVYHKRQWKWTQWKDLGKKMNVPMVAQRIDLVDAPNDGSLFVLNRYQGLDEESGNVYQYLYRTNDEAIGAINALFGMEIIVEEASEISKISGISNTSGSADIDDMLSLLFVLHLLWGKWEERDDVLHGVKIAIPLISSTMQYQSVIHDLVDRLRQLDIVIKMDELEMEEGVVIQLASRDGSLLEQFALWYKPLATWSVISTKDFTQSLVSSLEEFLGEEMLLPVDHLIKIGSVQ